MRASKDLFRVLVRSTGENREEGPLVQDAVDLIGGTRDFAQEGYRLQGTNFREWLVLHYYEKLVHNRDFGGVINQEREQYI